MAKKTTKKKIVTTVKKQSTGNKTTIKPTTSRSKGQHVVHKNAEPLLFGKQNYILMIAGVLVMTLGFLLMLGGEMPDPNTWNEDLIYSWQRTVLAPFLILAGLVILIWSIFKKKSPSQAEENLV